MLLVYEFKKMAGDPVLINRNTPETHIHIATYFHCFYLDFKLVAYARNIYVYQSNMQRIPQPNTEQANVNKTL